MVMALDDFCMACGPSRTKKHSSDVEAFMRNYKGLEKDELTACLMVTWEDVLNVMGQTVNCVGCRRSIETLYHSLRDCSDASMDPVIVTPEGFISINREHIDAPGGLATLFCEQIPRLTQRHVDEPNGKKVVARRGGRCPSHTLGQKSPIR
ncbi:gametogenetin-binding protein 2-like [Eurytemora carolleeae]|uniref:gametogenetin-binding protein 2-like n=1 Tax=Eurytemora carolleeae TaxID=1294199 RepID=UPI000C78C636|nr:gametogenetin-binding protein 2-like [Eurytemora carolleeae]|eukprot:XP_023322703.1 gametogenetin-binding protein 2-like [Eurytemora affinis]